jgi:hypothetical protein
MTQIKVASRRSLPKAGRLDTHAALGHAVGPVRIIARRTGLEPDTAKLLPGIQNGVRDQARHHLGSGSGVEAVTG